MGKKTYTYKVRRGYGESARKYKEFEINGTEARKAVAIIESIYRSAKENKEVYLV